MDKSDHTKGRSAGSTGSMASVGATGSGASTGSSRSMASKSGIEGEGEGGWGLEGVGGTEEGVWEKRMWVLYVLRVVKVVAAVVVMVEGDVAGVVQVVGGGVDAISLVTERAV